MDRAGNKRWFFGVCIAALTLNLVISTGFRCLVSPAVPPTNASPFFTLFEGIQTTLYAPYLIKEFVNGRIAFSIALGYHTVLRVEGFLFLITTVLGTYVLLRNLKPKSNVPLLLIVLAGILIGSIFSNEVEVLFSGAAVNYIKMTHSFVVRSTHPLQSRILLVQNFHIFNCADFLMTLAAFCLFWACAVMTLRQLWKTKQFYLFVFTSLMLCIVVCFPLLSTPSWVLEAKEHLSHQMQEDLQEIGNFDFHFDPNGASVSGAEPNVKEF